VASVWVIHHDFGKLSGFPAFVTSVCKAVLSAAKVPAENGADGNKVVIDCSLYHLIVTPVPLVLAVIWPAGILAILLVIHFLCSGTGGAI